MALAVTDLVSSKITVAWWTGLLNFSINQTISIALVCVEGLSEHPWRMYEVTGREKEKLKEKERIRELQEKERGYGASIREKRVKKRRARGWGRGCQFCK